MTFAFLPEGAQAQVWGLINKNVSSSKELAGSLNEETFSGNFLRILIQKECSFVEVTFSQDFLVNKNVPLLKDDSA